MRRFIYSATRLTTLVFAICALRSYADNPLPVIAARAADCVASGKAGVPACQLALSRFADYQQMVEAVSTDPQQFGIDIMNLQFKLVSLEQQAEALRASGHDDQKALQRLEQQIQQSSRRLSRHLETVAYLESPR